MSEFGGVINARDYKTVQGIRLVNYLVEVQVEILTELQQEIVSRKAAKPQSRKDVECFFILCAFLRDFASWRETAFFFALPETEPLPSVFENELTLKSRLSSGAMNC